MSKLPQRYQTPTWDSSAPNDPKELGIQQLVRRADTMSARTLVWWPDIEQARTPEELVAILETWLANVKYVCETCPEPK